MIIALVVLGYFLFRKFCKPTPILHDSTVLFTGGLGSGKSLNSVKTAIKAYKRAIFHWRIDCLKCRIHNRLKPNDVYEMPEKPLLKSNMPIRVKTNWKAKRGSPERYVYCSALTRSDLMLETRIPVNSVILLDELPQFINQFQWESAQGVLNEFITFFRHYVDGLLVCNAQSLDEVECHIRRKLSSYYYCFDFQPFFGIFYRVHILRCRVGDQSVSLTNEYIDENSKWHYGLLLFKPYDSRYLRHRYDKLEKVVASRFRDITTNKILRIDEDSYKSPLDDKAVAK